MPSFSRAALQAFAFAGGDAKVRKPRRGNLSLPPPRRHARLSLPAPRRRPSTFALTQQSLSRDDDDDSAAAAAASPPRHVIPKAAGTSRPVPEPGKAPPPAYLPALRIRRKQRGPAGSVPPSSLFSASSRARLPFSFSDACLNSEFALSPIRRSWLPRNIVKHITLRDSKSKDGDVPRGDRNLSASLEYHIKITTIVTWLLFPCCCPWRPFLRVNVTKRREIKQNKLNLTL